MAFADEYLQKHAIGNQSISELPDPNLKCIIAIPAYNESGLLRCLDSLFICDAFQDQCEVIVLINESESTSEEIVSTNHESYVAALEWIDKHKREKLHFHVLYVKNLPEKHFGAGLARKLVMDEAVRRLNLCANDDGIIMSLDADTTVDSNYISAVQKHFKEQPKVSGCSIQFKHPVEGDSFPPEVYRSIRNYEMHLRYYLQALRYTTYPYAFHTIGSCFAVRADVYCSQGGMSKRKAGEDFYFIQKVAGQGNFSECNTTTVYPSPRPSDRVPFGTGPEVSKQLKNPNLPYLTFAPELFQHLRVFYSSAPSLFKEIDSTSFLKKLHPFLRDFLLKNKFEEQLSEIRGNVASEKAFYQRFLRKYNMFWILKYLHFAEAQGVEKVEVGKAVRILAKLLPPT